MTIKALVKKFTPGFLLGFYHYKLALLGAVVFGFPGKSKKIKIIGVTGTSGKSTTVDFITRILEESGNKVASISTVRFKIADKEWKNELKMTMPGRFIIQKFLRRAINEKCQFIVLEVSSEGIKQFRHKFINFDTAVFTNLSPEHIESHGSFDKYRNEKLKLFLATKNIHIINISDENSDYFWQVEAKDKWGYKFKNQKSKCKMTNQNAKFIEAENIESTESGILFKIQDTRFQILIIGEFNVYNALAAICVAKNYGINLKTSATALEKVKGIPGRMEIVAKEPFMVVVDYAHTPEQLEGAYKSLNSQKSAGNKLICVLGSCGGGRDKWKRPELGKIAEKYCDKIIITNEDPYDEDPIEIIEQVAVGAGSKAEKILERETAIKKALEFAKDNDIVIITGKGAEPWMCVENGKKISWDDRKITKQFLEIR